MVKSVLPSFTWLPIRTPYWARSVGSTTTTAPPSLMRPPAAAGSVSKLP